MRNYWYLISSLPYLRFGEKPSMTAEAFRAACAGWLADDERVQVDAVLEGREPVLTGCAAAWWNGEVQLRDAVVRVRAKNRAADASPFIQPYDGFSATIEKAVTDAFTRPDPLEQEMELDRARWMLVDELAVTAPFSFAAILAFAVKVRISERWASMDDESGKVKVEELIEQSLTGDRNKGTSSE